MMVPPSTDPPRGLLIGYAFSGGFALVFQTAWYHAFIDRLGAASLTFVVVLTAFIGGLGAGSYFSDRVYSWTRERFGGHGLRNYGRTELLITLAVLVLYCLSAAPFQTWIGGAAYSSQPGPGKDVNAPGALYQLFRVGLPFFAVGVPCFGMGLTFPYLCSLYRQCQTFPSRLYAVNTLGACFAILASEFFLLRVVGYTSTLLLASAGTLLLGMYFLRFPSLPSESVSGMESPANGNGAANFPAVLSGLLCGGLQALVFVFLRLTYGPSRGAFALLSFFAIAGIWGAATLVQRFRPPKSVLVLLGWGGLAWCCALWFLEPRVTMALVQFGSFELTKFLPTDGAAFLTALACTGLPILLPYAAWSTVLPHVCNERQAAGREVASTYAANTFAFLTGVLVFGWILQYVNPFFAARTFGLLALASLVLLSSCSWRLPLRPVALAGYGLVLCLAFLIPRSLDMRLLAGMGSERYSVLDYRSSPQQFVWVRQNLPDGSRSLMFDRFSMSGTRFPGSIYMKTMAHFPLLLHESPRRALLICFGVGVTADAIRKHPEIERLDIVDLNKEVFWLNHYFKAQNADVLADARIRLFWDDGRQFVRMTQETYDFVTMEPPPPLHPGIARLYSLEYYESVRARLRSGGFVSQWLPEYQMNDEGVGLIISTFLEVFPEAFLFVGYGRELVLVGSPDPIPFARFPGRFDTANRRIREDFDSAKLSSASQVLAKVMQTKEALNRWRIYPVIRDGFSSLDSIELGPVQILSPVQSFRQPRSGMLSFDIEGTLKSFESQETKGTEEVRRLLNEPANDPSAQALVPPWYFPRRTPQTGL